MDFIEEAFNELKNLDAENILTERDLNNISEFLYSKKSKEMLRLIIEYIDEDEISQLMEYSSWLDEFKEDDRYAFSDFRESDDFYDASFIVDDYVGALVRKYEGQAYLDKYADEVMIHEDNLDKYFSRYIEGLSSDEIVDMSGIETGKSIKKGIPAFILPSGDVIDGDSTGGDVTHTAIVKSIFDRVFKSKIGESKVKIAYLPDDLSQYLNYMTFKLGWIRANPMTPRIEDRFYCVLPNKVTPSQYDMLKEFLDLGSHSVDKVLIYAKKDYDSHIYSFADNTVDEIVKKVKRFYSSGHFVECKKDIPSKKH